MKKLYDSGTNWGQVSVDALKRHTTKGKYAIVIDKVGGEFYPDPTYTDIAKLDAKMKYLAEYRTKSNMPKRIYIAEFLTPEREAQHDREWKRWVSMID